MSVIPLKIWQTWHTKDLPVKMRENMEDLKQKNPEFEHFLFDDDDCAEYIKNNFDISVYNAFQNLIPGPYKADLWRYCVLYKEGGIYLDLKFKINGDFKLITLTDAEYFVKDREGNEWFDKNGGVYQGFLSCLAGNEILFKCIQQIVVNVENKNYNLYGSLYPTGPGLMGSFTTLDEKNTFKLRFLGDGIYFNNNKILGFYNEYTYDVYYYRKTRPYDELWLYKNVYL